MVAVGSTGAQTRSRSEATARRRAHQDSGQRGKAHEWEHSRAARPLQRSDDELSPPLPWNGAVAERIGRLLEGQSEVLDSRLQRSGRARELGEGEVRALVDGAVRESMVQLRLQLGEVLMSLQEKVQEVGLALQDIKSVVREEVEAIFTLLCRLCRYMEGGDPPAAGMPRPGPVEPPGSPVASSHTAAPTHSPSLTAGEGCSQPLDAAEPSTPPPSCSTPQATPSPPVGESLSSSARRVMAGSPARGERLSPDRRGRGSSLGRSPAGAAPSSAQSSPLPRHATPPRRATPVRRLPVLPEASGAAPGRAPTRSQGTSGLSRSGSGTAARCDDLDACIL